MRSLKFNFIALVFIAISGISICAQGTATKTVTETVATTVKNENGKPAVEAMTKTAKDAVSPAPADADDEVEKVGNEIVSKYVNYLEEYRLGPNDIITVEVFNQCPDYCRFDVVVPPTAKISYPLIREGVMVSGRTTEEIQDVITKQLEEYIIDPKVTVTLVKAGSARFSVMGKVNMGGIRIMDRRISITDAILEAGGMAKDADKKKVLIARMDTNGFLKQEYVNYELIEKGKAPVVYLQPGDQVIVPGKRFTWEKVLGIIQQASAARILFGSPF